MLRPHPNDPLTLNDRLDVLRVVEDLVHDHDLDPVFLPVLSRAAKALRDADDLGWLLALSQLPDWIRHQIDEGGLNDR